ncbi:hypothetical protein M9H77_21750 [Catharanthus roseus]|uniref:Uncharacterized protein n=1 Tax=Catharanthus roseus TaxID=4058 RepID=A0ACC0AN62_CATRO|nr:hypothetical protein M9H77_21750 [Catharanthus roseus]
MDLKKRKLDENGLVLTDSDAMGVFGPNKLTLEDARKILEPFSREQLLEIVQTALLRHVEVLDAVRSIADRDPAQRKLFIRGLGWETTTDKLRTLFAQYGDLEEAVVILDKATGKSKGYGFVTFKHIDGAMQALKEPSKKIDGRMTVTQLAAAGTSGGPGGGGTNPVDVSMRKIYVANVPYDMPAERLLAHFSMYGEIEEGPLGFDKTTGKSKGFALFVYKTAEAARASLVDPIKNIDGHQLNCKLAIDGKKGGRSGAGDPGATHGSREGHGDVTGVGMHSGVAGQYGGPGGAGGLSGYSGFSGPSPLAGNHFNPTSGGVAGGPGLTGVGSHAAGSNLGAAGGFGSSIGGPYGSGSHFGAFGAGGYGGLGGSGGGLGGAGAGITGAGGGLGGTGSGLGAGRGSSLYGLPPSSGGLPTGDYPQSTHYSLPSSVYQSQHHHSTGTSPAPRGPSGGLYQGMPPYY